MGTRGAAGITNGDGDGVGYVGDVNGWARNQDRFDGFDIQMRLHGDGEPVPVPATIALLGLSLLGLRVAKRRV